MTDDAPFDAASLELEVRRSAAWQRVRTGGFLISLLPIGLALTGLLAQLPGELALAAALMSGAALAVFGPIAGLAMTARGLLEVRRVSRLACLPAARVIRTCVH